MQSAQPEFYIHPHQHLTDEEFGQDFSTLSKFGKTEAGGVERQALSAADAAQRHWFQAWMEAHGLQVAYDCVGNQFGLWKPVPGADFVLTGSHLDSQPNAGAYDGAYGVLASAYAVVRCLREAEETGIYPLHNLAVVNWCNEEGSRFEPSMMGSGVFCGKLDAGLALKTEDTAGTTVAEALAQAHPQEFGEAADAGQDTHAEAPPVCAYAEIHIEQGRILEDTQTTIGLVTATWAAQKYHLVIHGEQAHTGSTVMAERKDALLGASLLVVAARAIADELEIHSSVGQLLVEPNSPVVVPALVRMHLDLRSPDPALVRLADQRLQEVISRVEEDAQVRVEKASAHGWEHTPFQPAGVEIARTVCADLGVSHREIMTVAGHDATNVKDLAPTVMLFVPSVEGISHAAGEFTTHADMCAGSWVLTEVVKRLAAGALS